MNKVFTISMLSMVLLLALTGCLVVSITEDMQNPFTVTINWDGTALVPEPDTGSLPLQTLDENGAVVSVSVKDERGSTVVPETYEWYINDELILTGSDTVVIDGSRASGTLSVIVGQGEILSSEQVLFTHS
jgi:hypothetical protein